MKLGYHTLPENVTTMVGVVTVLTLAEAAFCYLIHARGEC
jgi:hypothetical protein